jgi:parvulin-like peptidyl-prolyl isomerase
MRLATLGLLAVLLAVAPAALADGSDPADPLPEGAVASVRGQVLTHRDLMVEVVRRLGRLPAGTTVLEQVVVSHALEQEAERRGIVLAPADIEAFVTRLETAAGGAERLDAGLQQQGLTRDDLREMARLELLSETMAAADLKLKGKPNKAQGRIWLESLRKRLGEERDRKELPEGVAARIGDREVTDVEFGTALERKAGPGLIGERVLEPWITVVVIEQDLAKRSIEVSDEEVEADIERRRREFQGSGQAQALGVTFEQMLEAKKGWTLDDLREDREYRAALGLRKLLADQVTEEKERAWFDENRDLFGERRRVQHILIAAGRDETFGSGGRTAAEARRLAFDLAKQIRTGTRWNEVAQQYDKKGLKPVLWSKASNVPPKVLAAVFDAKPGELVGPVNSLHGYHLVTVAQVVPPMQFEEAKARVSRIVLQKLEREYKLALRDDPAIVRAERYR